MIARALVFLIFLICSVTSLAAQTAAAVVDGIVTSEKFKAATGFLQGDHERFVRELVTLTEIPAPPFKEKARAAAFLDMLRGAGLSSVETDAEGNVMGVRKGTGAANGPMLAVLAHLDTVFPEGTDDVEKQSSVKAAQVALTIILAAAH